MNLHRFPAHLIHHFHERVRLEVFGVLRSESSAAKMKLRQARGQVRRVIGDG